MPGRIVERKREKGLLIHYIIVIQSHISAIARAA